MKLLAIDRSTDTLSVALAQEGGITVRAYDGADARNADWPVKIRSFLAENALEFTDFDRIVIGTGPGSFAGIRGALAFAQGLAVGIRSKRADLNGAPIVYGLPSPSALAGEEGPVAVVGDARRGLFWVVVYDGGKTVSDFRLVEKDALAAAVPENASVATSDGARIGEVLEDIFKDRYSGSIPPSAGALARIALDSPQRLVPEPLPVYLSPAVRV